MDNTGNKITRGTWVMVRMTVLEPGQRTAHLPEETRRVPLVATVKGTLAEDAYVGERATVETITRKIVHGVLDEVEPSYAHDFGHHVEALRDVRRVIDGETEDL
jgi:2-amino-4-ketopentanoate thiolase alpha subunit